MKKLLSVFAATALLFGFVSCSGDLHDASEINLAKGAVPGAFNGWDNKSPTWTSVNQNVYTYEFTAEATEAEWKCIAVAGNWNSGAFGGGETKVTETPVGSTVNLTYDGATGGYKNAKITGMEIGSGYRITVTVNVVEATCKVECIKPVPKFFMLVKQSDGTVVSEAMTPTTGGYNYLIKSDSAGSIDFQICGANMLYYSEGTEIKVGFKESEAANYKISSSYTTFKYDKGEYLIFVGTSEDDFSEVTLEVKYAALLKSGFFAINGPMGIKPLKDNGDGSYSVEFEAAAGGWGADEGDMCFTLYAQLTEEAMKSDKWWDKTIYRAGGFECKVGEKTTCEKKGDNITLKNIENKGSYKATFTSDANNIYILVEKK